MIWVDLAVALLAFVVLVLAGLGLYQRGRSLVRALGASSTRIADASVDLNAQQAKTPVRR